jgi:hypothetical protein
MAKTILALGFGAWLLVSLHPLVTKTQSTLKHHSDRYETLQEVAQ